MVFAGNLLYEAGRATQRPRANELLSAQPLTHLEKHLINWFSH
jgi:hypothetical protein